MVIRTGTHGGSMIGVLLAVPILFLIAWESQNLLRAKAFELQISRYANRMGTLKNQIENAGASRAALYVSAVKGNNQRLKNCLLNQICRDNSGNFEAYQLFNSRGTAITGKHRLGMDRASNSQRDVLQVLTEIEIKCAQGVAQCPAPASIKTKFRIEQSGTQAFKGRILKPIESEVEFAALACGPGEYVYGVDERTFQPKCTKAKLFAFGNSCLDQGAAYEVTAKAEIKCAPVVDYCGKDIAFAMVLDRSGSMRREGKITGVKSAASEFIDKTRNNDEAAIVSFSSAASTNSNRTKTKAISKSAIAGLSANGMTNMTSALTNAEQELKVIGSDRPKVIVFLSDGQHNVGPGPETKAAELKKAGYIIWTIGFGRGADEPLLRRMASSNADYSFAMNAADLNKRFDDLAKLMCRKP